MHIRTRIRNAARAALVTALPDHTSLFLDSRAIDDKRLPAFRVFARSERVQTEQVGLGDVKRDVTLLILVNILGGETGDDQLDATATIIENTLIADPDLQSICDLTLLSAAASDDAKAERAQLALQMEFNALTITVEGDPTTLAT